MNHLLKLIQNSLAVVAGAVLMSTAGVAFAAEARDCSKAPEGRKEQCEARNKADAKCGKLEGDARRICQRDMVGRDCSKSENKARCEAEVAAHKACRGDAKTYRTCYESKTKKG